MDKATLIKKMVAEYQAALPTYTVMQRYYRGDHDIIYKVWSNPKRCNKICIENFIAKCAYRLKSEKYKIKEKNQFCRTSSLV